MTGLQTDASIKNPLLSMVAVATGSDGYKAMVSVGEIQPNFGKRDALVAYTVDGAAPDRNGMARLVVPGDGRASRHVSNLVSGRCIDHDPMATVERLCERHQVPFRPVRSASAARFAALLSRLAQAQRQPPGPRLCIRHG